MGWFTSIKKGIINSFGNIRIYKGGIVLWGTANYGINGEHQRAILNVIEPGDIIFRRYNAYIGSIAVPGYWSHVGVYVGDKYNVIHAAGGGVTTDDILTFMRADSLCLARCADPIRVTAALKYSRDELEAQTPYDYDFKAKNDALYCSELVWNGFGQPQCDRKIDKYIIPDDLLNVDIFDTLITIKN